jgi:hypothetical protein
VYGECLLLGPRRAQLVEESSCNSFSFAVFTYMLKGVRPADGPTYDRCCEDFFVQFQIN